MTSHLLDTYNPLPIYFTHGERCYLYDKDNNQYLDALGGIAVCALGHNHPKVTQTISDQASKLLHTSNVYQIPHCEALADKLFQLSGMQKVFVANSGTEANECAIKLTRLYGHKKNIKKPKILVFDGAFHGRTMGALSATASEKVRHGYDPYLEGFARVAFNDLDAVKKALVNDNDIVAIMLEPIQGEGGIHVPDKDYLKGIYQLSQAHDCLLIIDEIQTGMGRTGKFFAYMHAGIKPDIVTSAKALGNGVPIGACLVSNRALDLMAPGMHGSTFGGNPFTTKVAHTVLTILEQDNLITRAAYLGDLIKTNLKQHLKDNTHIKDIRGQGLMMGIELDKPCRDTMKLGLKHRILFNVTANNVIRLLPPYILTDEQANTLVERIVKVIQEFYNS